MSNGGLDRLYPSSPAFDKEILVARNGQRDRMTHENHPILVSWNGPDDPDNPRNWSTPCKIWITAVVSIYSFVVYCGSSICIMSYDAMAIRYGTSTQMASLALSLYVLGYGIGPLLWSPLSEMPKIGRNPPYILTFLTFVVLSIVLCYVDNFAAILTIRFLQGFLGSPCLATAGASIQDILGIDAAPYAYIVWVQCLCCGPALAPLFASYAVTIDWRWPFWQIACMSAPVLLALTLLMPETSHETILIHKACHLRQHTGNKNIYAPGELDPSRVADTLVHYLVKPLEISIKDPSLAFAGVYTAFIYAIYYSFFEAFPRLYLLDYRMSPHSFSLTFLALVVGALIGGTLYAIHLYYSKSTRTSHPPPKHEYHLIPAIPATGFASAGLFFFAGTASASFHWMIPTTGVAVYSAAIFVIFQSLLIYVPLSYPRYAASLLAANDFVRSGAAAVFVMVTPYMYNNLGVKNGVIVLASVSVLGVVGMVVLYRVGGRLRARSKFTH